jgi:hypothetical protein
MGSVEREEEEENLRGFLIFPRPVEVLLSERLIT